MITKIAIIVLTLFLFILAIIAAQAFNKVVKIQENEFIEIRKDILELLNILQIKDKRIDSLIDVDDNLISLLTKIINDNKKIIEDNIKYLHKLSEVTQLLTKKEE